MSKIRNALPLVGPFLLSACAASAPLPDPVGPGVFVLPGADISFDQFVADDGVCRQFAATRAGASTPGHASAAGNPASSGSDSEGRAFVTRQEHYDIGYMQCMYAKGHRVPVDSQSAYESRLDGYPPPPPPPPLDSMVPEPAAGERSR